MSLSVAATAVAFVANGIAAGTTASTIAAGAFIGSSVAFGLAALTAASNSNSVQDFYNQGSWSTIAATAGGALYGGYNGYSITGPSAPYIGSHTSGVGSPQKNVNPGGSYTKLDNNGNLYSYTQFDSLGRQTMRIDFQGRPHAGVLPHIHLYTYPAQGGRAEYVFNLNWDLIN